MKDKDDIDFIVDYIDCNDLSTRNRSRVDNDRRMYIYAYMYYILGIEDMSKIGSFFRRDRTTVLFHIKNYNSIKDDKSFIHNTKSLRELLPMNDVGEYVDRAVGKRGCVIDVMKNGNYRITIQVTRAQGIKFLKSKDENLILDIMFAAMLKDFSSKKKLFS